MEQKNQLQASSKLEMQSTKQRANSLINYATTGEEIEIIKALGDIRLKEITKEEADRLIELVGKWAFYMGSTSRLSSDDILMLSKFLKDNYGFLTINEIHLAISLNMKGHLGRIEYYGNLTPLFMSNVLNAYVEHKHECIKPVLERKAKDDLPPTPKMTDEETLAMTKDAFRLEYAKYKKNGVIDDLFSIIYTFIDKNNRIIQRDGLKEEAFSYAQKMLQRDSVKEAKNLGDLIRNAVNKDDTIRFEKHFQNYIVIDLFSRINNIEEYVSGISINENL